MVRKVGVPVVVGLLCCFLFTQKVNPIGTWNGQNTLHVPMAWCIVQGSPAQANPNVAGDTVTDDVIWRRHERPTDSIYINQAGITFRSAINNAWTVLDFPIIADPDTTLGTPGDMRGENVNTNGAEFNQLINNCDAAWAAAPLNRAGIGITAVNAGLFHDGTGTYVGVIGWGGCTQSVANPGVCATPYDGRIAVVDNHYLHPSVANRTFPGTNLQFILTDPMDQLVGHENGHALSLPHRTNAQALMNPGQTDNDGDGQTDNIALNATEVNALRASGMVVPGLEQDPPGEIIKGNVAALRQVDKVRETRLLKPHLDLASVKVALDTKQDEVSIGQQLFGLIPKTAPAVEVWLLMDSDPTRGATPTILREIGVPPTRFQGADLVLRANVEKESIQGDAWILRDERLVKLTDGIKFDLQALIMYPHYSAIDSKPSGFPVHHVVAVIVANRWLGIRVGKPFRLQTIVIGRGEKVADKLDDTREERGVEFVLEHPSFPHCYPRGEAEPGGTVRIELEGLKPNRGIHGLLGPRLVFRGETDDKGGGTIDFRIPKDADPGLHLVTIGNDRTALTADCVVRVRGGAKQQQ